MILGKVLYGALFVVVLPALLLAWARATAGVVTVPTFTSLPVGAALAGTGAALILAGWYALYRHGGGLPMNAFPPPRYVARGVYALVPHPIYVGGAALAFGISIAAGSSSGFWLVSPTLALSAVALVYGYEKHDLRARFGEPVARPFLSLPPAEDAPPTLAERLALYPLVIGVWAALYGVVMAAGLPPDARSSFTAFEARLPVFEGTEAIYALTYPFVLLSPLAARSRRDLRALSVNALLACALIYPLYLALPLTAPPRPFTPGGPLGHLLALERGLDTPGAAFPSFHVVWAFLAADAFASRWPRLRLPLRALGLAIAASCFTTGMHSLADVAAGLVAYLLVTRHAAVWEALRALAERAANSWYEWRIGPLRIINHGIWGGLATGTGLLLIGWLMGPGHALSILVPAVGGLVGAGLWAQIIEGSPSLLRPYGFYGGLLGVILGCVAAPLTGTSVWLLLAACATAAPAIQALGRVRCLVQGCCHGHETTPRVGIRVHHPRSRVVRLSPLGGVPVHPTQLYSILWNAASALVLGRLWTLHAPQHFIAGIYLLLNGLGRVVEEAYRGEPQTPIYFRLRFYQWAALGSMLGGGLMTALGSSDAAPTPELSWPVAAIGLAFGAFTWFATGVDFPESNRRFARLV
jgi:protein-S-isoprenylcysteine O-methyltransferase Ste14